MHQIILIRNRLHSFGDHRPVGRDRIRSRPKILKTGRDPEKNSGRDPQSIAIQKKIPVATRDRSRPRKFFGSRPRNFSENLLGHTA
jgi:hypothetical protein